MPKFASNTQRIQVRNGQYIGVLFVIPVIIDVHGHRFEIFMLVSEIHRKCRFVLVKNIFELEGVIDLCDSCFSFSKPVYPPLPQRKDRNQSKRTKAGHNRSTICRRNIRNGNSENILDMQEQVTVMIKLKFIRNRVQH